MSEILAEVRVAVVPDASTFGALLQAEIAAASRAVPPVVVPVQVSAATQTAQISQAVAAANQAAQAATATATAQTTATRATKALTAEQKLQARAANLLAISQEEVLNVTSAQAAAQITATRSAAALAVARRAEAAITASTAQATKDAIANTLALAEAQNLEAQAALRAATAQAAHASSLGTLGRGSAATGLSILGVRGATLAANSAFLVGAVAAAGFAGAIKTATSLNTEIAVLGATTGATAEQLERAREAAREFGRDISLPGVTAGDAAQTITEFSKAGLTLNESIAATRGGLQLAQAAQLSYAEAVELSANSLNSFNLQGTQAVHVADVLANASNLAQGNIADMGLALRQAAGAAQVVGVSFEDTVALLTQLAQNGLTGSDAGTALRTAFIRLINPSKEAKQILQDLNVQLRDAQGNVRPEVFNEFAQAQRNLSVATQQANAAIVFGQDAFRVIGILGQEAPGSLDQVRAGLEQTGTAAKIAQARMSGLRGAAENLQNQLNTLGGELGDLADGPLAIVLDQLADFVEDAGAAAVIAKAFAGALKDIVPPAPKGSEGFLDKAEQVFLKTNIFEVVGFLGDQLGIEGQKAQDSAEKVGVDVRDGLESAARQAVQGARSFQSEVVGALQPGFEQINQALRAGAAKVRAAAAASIQGAQGQQSGLEEAFDRIVAGGGSQQEQIANLRRQAATQARIIERAGPDAQGVLLEARRRAQAKQASIESQITSIEKSISAAAQAARDERQRIRDENKRNADQAFLVEQQDARDAAQRRVSLAGDTTQLSDDIRRQAELRALISKQIIALRASSLDEKTKQAAIKDLVKARQATTDEIKRLRAADAEQRREAAAEQVAARGDLLADLTQIAELRGDEAGQVQGLRAEIAFWRKVAIGAEKGSEAQRDAILAVEQKRKELRDLLKQAKDDADQGKSILEFLTENNSLFQSVASNIGTVGVDPLSGFDFSQSLVAGLTRLQQAARAGGGVGPSRGAGATQTRVIDPQIDKLIAALERNTEATIGNTSSGGTGLQRYANVTGQRAAAMGRFWEAVNARKMEEDAASGGV